VEEVALWIMRNLTTAAELILLVTVFMASGRSCIMATLHGPSGPHTRLCPGIAESYLSLSSFSKILRSGYCFTSVNYWLHRCRWGLLQKLRFGAGSAFTALSWYRIWTCILARSPDASSCAAEQQVWLTTARPGCAVFGSWQKPRWPLFASCANM